MISNHKSEIRSVTLVNRAQYTTPEFTPYPQYSVSPSARPSVGDVMKLAENMSTMGAKTKLLEIQTCNRVDQQNEELDQLDKQIAGVDACMNTVLCHQGTIEWRLVSAIKQLEAKITRLGK